MGPPEEFKDATDKAKQLLEEVGYRTPTPVEDIVACANLVVAGDIKLIEKREGFLQRAIAQFQGFNVKTALSKILGIVDLRENLVYVDSSVLPVRQSFIKLHEVGHRILPWQSEIFLEDASTLDPRVKKRFEVEANHVAAELMFQVDKFDIEARDYKLSIDVPLSLADKYGSSKHSAIRRYIERNGEPCALLVLDSAPTVSSEGAHFRIQYKVHSPSFEKKYGTILSTRISPSEPFYEQMLNSVNRAEGYCELMNHGKTVSCIYQLFSNSYRYFIFIKQRRWSLLT